MNNLRKRTIQGLTWSGAAQFFSQMISFIITVFLARLLDPQEFGLITMITIFTGFAGLCMELGLGAAIIQKNDIEQRHLSSIFWINIFMGLVLSLVIACAGPGIARFYNEPILQPLTLLISVNFFIGSLGVVQMALLNKELAFQRLAVIQIISLLGAGTVGILLARAGYGAWSLAWQSTALTSMTMILLWFTGTWRPRWEFDFTAVRELTGFGANLLGHKMLNYWMSNLDNFLIGRYIGSASLGIYSRAYQLMLLPMNQVSSVITRVMFPVLSSIHEDKKRIKQIYLKAIGQIALVTFPLMLGLLVTAPSFVPVVFGPKWNAIVPVLQVFCIVGLSHSILTTTGWIYMSQGRTDWMFKWGIYASVVKGLGIITGLKWGILGVAIGYTAVNLIFLLYPGFAIPGRLIGMTWSDVGRRVAGPLGCAAAMAAAVWGVGLLLPDKWPHWAYLTIQILFGAISYLMLIHLFGLRAYLELKQLAREQWRGTRRLS